MTDKNKRKTVFWEIRQLQNINSLRTVSKSNFFTTAARFVLGITNLEIQLRDFSEQNTLFIYFNTTLSHFISFV